MVPDRIRLRRVILCEPVDGVVEAAAVVAYGDQVWAMTARLEWRTGSFICVHLGIV
jgi:hypothetical protein